VGQFERRVPVGESRAARKAGYRPATAPITTAALSPAQMAAAGTSGRQSRVSATA
jgi:hypothetical protein